MKTIIATTLLYCGLCLREDPTAEAKWRMADNLLGQTRKKLAAVNEKVDSALKNEEVALVSAEKAKDEAMIQERASMDAYQHQVSLLNMPVSLLEMDNSEYQPSPVIHLPESFLQFPKVREDEVALNREQKRFDDDMKKLKEQDKTLLDMSRRVLEDGKHSRESLLASISPASLLQGPNTQGFEVAEEKLKALETSLKHDLAQSD